MNDEKKLRDVGPCCLCEHSGDPANPVRNQWMLPVEQPRPQPLPWGCPVCELPLRGASALLCDRCASKEEEMRGVDSWKLLKTYCAGPDLRGRAPIAELFHRPAWKHDMSKHPESDRRHSINDPF